MIGHGPGRHLRFPGRRPTSDTESLQTDVMRFMAILGLCLTAVFALVRSIPQPLEASPPEPAANPDLLRQVSARQLRLSTLEQQAALAKDRLQEKQNGIAQAEVALTEVQSRLRAVLASEERTRKEQDLARAEMHRLNRELAREQQRVTAAERTTRHRERQLADTERLLQETREELTRQATIERSLEPVTPEPIPPADKRQPAPRGPVAAPAESGFVLRFESDSALDRLLRTRSARFFAMLGTQAWSLTLRGPRPIFTEDAFPRRFYEMSPATVPPSYRQALRLAAGATSPQPVVWGVELPASVEHSVTALMRNAAGGVLVIGGDGAVDLTRGQTQ